MKTDHPLGSFLIIFKVENSRFLLQFVVELFRIAMVSICLIGKWGMEEASWVLGKVLKVSDRLSIKFQLKVS